MRCAVLAHREGLPSFDFAPCHQPPALRMLKHSFLGSEVGYVTFGHRSDNAKRIERTWSISWANGFTDLPRLRIRLACTQRPISVQATGFQSGLHRNLAVDRRTESLRVVESVAQKKDGERRASLCTSTLASLSPSSY
eukprot:2687795-Rhodomonas_salina.2